MPNTTHRAVAPSKVEGRGSYDPQRTRQRLLDSALELFGSQGFNATSMQQIVDRAGVTKGAFYHHFESKEEVLQVIHDEFLDVQAADMQRILAEFDSPVDQLRETVRMSVLSVARYHAHVAIFFQDRRNLTGEREQAVRARRDLLDKEIAGIVQRGLDAGLFDPSIGLRVAVFGSVGISVWVHQWFRADGPIPAEDVADQLASMVLHGVVLRE